MINYNISKWTIISKIRITLAFAFVAGGVLYFEVLHHVIYPSYIQMEYQRAVTNIERVIFALEREEENLSLLCADWASWDATYDYMESRSPNYIDESYGYDTFKSNRLNLIYVVESDGTVRWGKIYNIQTATPITIPEIPVKSLSLVHPLLHDETAAVSIKNNDHSGVYLTSLGPMLISTKPILTSENKGPSRGFIIMGRMLSPDMIAKLNRLTHVRFTLRNNKFWPGSCHYESTNQSSLHTGAYCLETQDADVLRTYSDYPAIAGGTAFVIQAELPREIYREAKKVMVYSAFALLLSLIFIIALISLLLKKLINDPISNLKAHILNIKQLGDLNSRFPIESKPCNDEILVLAKEFNGMLGRLSTMSKELKKANSTLEVLTKTDPLTNIANRRRFNEHLEKQWRLMKRVGKPISLLMCDVDFFKLYNDFYGHQSGDECLTKVAQALQRSVHRPCDLVARYGGEEFVVVLPDTNLQGAVGLAEKMRKQVEDLNISHCKSTVDSWVTLSLGVACLLPDDVKSGDDLIELADQALYLAKENGRNRWHTLQEDNPEAR